MGRTPTGPLSAWWKLHWLNYCLWQLLLDKVRMSVKETVCSYQMPIWETHGGILENVLERLQSTNMRLLERTFKLHVTVHMVVVMLGMEGWEVNSFFLFLHPLPTYWKGVFPYSDILGPGCICLADSRILVSLQRMGRWQIPNQEDS